MNHFSKGGVYDTRKTGEAFRGAEDRHVAPLEAGSSLDKIVSATVVLADEEDFAGMNEEWLRWFPANPPARQGAKLPAKIPGLRRFRVPQDVVGVLPREVAKISRAAHTVGAITDENRDACEARFCHMRKFPKLDYERTEFSANMAHS
jgi:hypothetical protein